VTYREIREAAYEANVRIVQAGLVLLTWGNASAADRESGVYAIKPSGVPYAELGPESMVVVSIEDGSVVDGNLRPSSDRETHTEIYRGFEGVGGIVHTHSHFAVCFAHALREIPCYGTTHADHFADAIPVTRQLTAAEVAGDYERETGRVIVERFHDGGLDPMAIPGVLIAHHGPFAWGESAEKATENAIVLEEVARMGLHTESLSAAVQPAPRRLVEKHFYRKHGTDAYYGQPEQ
jgi:L-ribulose-5-phosphate 4-epimerase